jgi:hypothetical protein
MRDRTRRTFTPYEARVADRPLATHPNLDTIVLQGYIPSMACEVEFTDEFNVWWEGLNEGEQDDVAAIVGVLEEYGPGLRRPYSGIIKRSKHPNMKELIVQHMGEPYRVIYIFDPHRNAILLLGGNKTGDARWYEVNVPIADKIYDEYLKLIAREGPIR